MAVTETSAEPILEISTFTTRRFITIDGERFFIRNRGEFSVLENLRLEEIAEKLRGVLKGFQAGEVDEKAEDDASVALSEAVRMIVVDLPEGLELKIGDGDKLQVVFGSVAIPAADPTKPRTGAKSSRGSKRGTAATKAAG